MLLNKKPLVLITLIIISVMAVSATLSPVARYKNLKILPQDISEAKMDSIMKSYTKALKVSCDFCHEEAKKDPFSIVPITSTGKVLDYALDNGMKENARKMMLLTIDINKNYFRYDSLVKPVYLNVVSCNTCHRGDPYPANAH